MTVDTKALILVTVILTILWISVFMAAQTELRV